VRNFVQHNIEFILLGAVVVTLVPTLYHVWKNQRAAKRAASSDTLSRD
jgi:membrane-associated protein